MGSKEEEEEDGSNWVLILSFAVLVPALICGAAIYLACLKRRRRREQRRSDAEAKRENELNANKTKMIDDHHMIVNALDFPLRQKRTNNPNIADEEFHFGKDGSSVSGGESSIGGHRSSVMVGHSPGCGKQLNTALLSTKLGGDSSPDPAGVHHSPTTHQHHHHSSPQQFDKPRLSNLPGSARRGLNFETGSSSGNSSVCSR